MSILFNIILPAIVLSKLSSSELFGPVNAFIIALLFPISYGVVSLIKEKRFDFVAVLGILSIILLPFTIMFNILNFMLDNVVHFHTEPKDFMNSTWNNYGYYYFRYYNELPHIVNQRLYLALNEAVSFNSNFKKIEQIGRAHV